MLRVRTFPTSGDVRTVTRIGSRPVSKDRASWRSLDRLLFFGRPEPRRLPPRRCPFLSSFGSSCCTWRLRTGTMTVHTSGANPGSIDFADICTYDDVRYSHMGSVCDLGE